MNSGYFQFEVRWFNYISCYDTVMQLADSVKFTNHCNVLQNVSINVILQYMYMYNKRNAHTDNVNVVFVTFYVTMYKYYVIQLVSSIVNAIEQTISTVLLLGWINGYSFDRVQSFKRLPA